MTSTPDPFRRVPHPGGRGSIYTVTCSTCGVTESMGQQDLGETKVQQLLTKKARTRGWDIGRKGNTCPGCISRHSEERRRSTHLKLVKEPVVPAEQPRQMERADRRLIISKLEEVYIDEGVGYASGWDDERIATDLGVPRAWVSTLREENFGPDTSEDDKALDELRALLDASKASVATVEGEYKRLSTTLSEIRAAHAALEKRLSDIEARRKRSFKAA